MADSSIILELFVQALISGMIVGCIYGLMCLGLAIIFGIMDVINFAHGDLMMIGMYITYAVLMLLGGTFLANVYFATLITFPLAFLVGYFLHWGLISRVSGTKTMAAVSVNESQLILTLGVSLVLENVMLMLFGSESYAIRSSVVSGVFAFDYFPNFVIFVDKVKLIAALGCVAIFVLFTILFNKSTIGKSLRASADNPIAATYMGINIDQIYRIAFGIGTCLTVTAGSLLATYYPFQPFIGLQFVVIMFAGVVIGGMGSVKGAFWGGVLIGLVQQLSTLFLPLQLQNMTIFVFFILVMLLRPQGLFGKKIEKA